MGQIVHRYRVIDQGVWSADTFPGCGSGGYEDVANGLGETPADAFGDALETLSQFWDVNTVDEEGEDLSDASDLMSEADEIGESDSDESESEDSNIYAPMDWTAHYVSVQVSGDPLVEGGTKPHGDGRIYAIALPHDAPNIGWAHAQAVNTWGQYHHASQDGEVAWRISHTRDLPVSPLSASEVLLTLSTNAPATRLLWEQLVDEMPCHIVAVDSSMLLTPPSRSPSRFEIALPESGDLGLST